MVHDHLWKLAGMGDGYLCIGCLELRLGHSLCATDFRTGMTNDSSLDTERLRSRKHALHQHRYVKPGSLR
jgi:hypothetical protein